MSKRSIQLKKVLTPTDAVAVIVIIVGLLIAIFLTEVAIRLIGICVAILGSVALVMLISQRLSEVVESRFKPSSPPPSFKVTVKHDDHAKRTVIEDFESEFGSDINNTEDSEDADDLIEVDEGFRIKSGGGGDDNISPEIEYDGESEDIEENSLSRQESKEPQSFGQNFRFDDENSGMRIIGVSKKPAVAKNASANSELHFNTGGDDQDSKDDSGTIPLDFEAEVTNQAAGEENIAEGEPVEIDGNVIDGKLIDTKPSVRLYKKKELNIPFSDLIEEAPTVNHEPRKEFDYFLKRVLMIIRSVTNTRTAVFFLVNSAKREFVLESVVTDVPDKISDNKRFKITNDVVSQIAVNLKPEILSEINPSAELDLIPYYKKSVGSVSFIGVPVFYNNMITGVLCADSDIVDAYDSVTVGFLGHFTKLIAGLVHSYTEKFDLIQASRTLDAVNIFHQFSNNPGATPDDISNSIVESVSQIIDCQAIGFCAFDDNSGAWIIKSASSKGKDVNKIIGTPVNLNATVLGNTITTSATNTFVPVNQNSVRVYSGEDDISGGIFCSVSVMSMTGTFGALYIEDSNPGAVSSLDILLLETIADQAGSALEKLYFMDMINNSSLIDPSTGILNIPAFNRRIEEELFRCAAYNQPMSLFLFKLDEYTSFDPEQFRERVEKMLYHVINIVRNKIKVYDIFGKASHDIFAIGLVNTDPKDAKMRTDRIRNEIANTLIEMDGKSFTVTISGGIAGASNVNSVDRLIGHALTALEVSLTKTNSISIFS